MVNRRVLVVDDDADIRAALASILADEGYSVQTACNGVEALREMTARLPDVILLDLMMPVMDGWRVLRHVRADARLRSIPVVVLSALRAPAGTDHVQKPISLQKLLTLLGTVRQRVDHMN